MTDDIREGLIYIVGHVHAPPLQQAPVLACGLPSMPTRKSVEKLYAIQKARDWIQDQIDKVEEEQAQKAQEPVPFVESTPESYHEENGAARLTKTASIATAPSDDPLAAIIADPMTIAADTALGFEELPDRLMVGLTRNATVRPTLDDAIAYGRAAPVIEVPQLRPAPIKRRRSSKRRVVYINGKTYRTLSHAARAHGLNEEAGRSRVKRGWTIAQALEVTPAPRAVVIEGKVFPTLADACRAYEVDYHAVRARVTKGEAASRVIASLG